MTSRRTDVAVVIPTCNAGRGLAGLLDALDAQNGRYRPIVMAIDSGSTDGTRDLLKARGIEPLIIAREEFDHGETRNRALSRVGTEFAVLLVQDALPASSSWLEALVAPLASDASLAGTWARQQPRDDASRLTAHYAAGWAGAQADGRTEGPLTDVQFAALTPAARHRVCTFDNVCSCVRMAVWRDHPFPRTCFGEDIEWAKTVLRAGHRLAFVPGAVVIHSHERSVTYELKRAYLAHQRLQSLFGLTTVPNAGALAVSMLSCLPLHLRLAVSEPARSQRRLMRAIGLAVALPLGQYLGARAARRGRELRTVRGV